MRFPQGSSVLVTGAAGFIGHHLVEHILRQEPGVERVVLLDRLDVSGTLMRFPDIETWEDHVHRVRFVYHDLKAPIQGYVDEAIGDIDYVMHLAASSHVDRSIQFPMEFVQDNVVGTVNLLDWVRERHSIKQLLYFSTDEVYGPAPEECYYLEGDRHNPGNPYAASKAAAEDMVRAYRNTYQLPLVILNCMNVFGERQHPEKFVPMTIGKCLRGDVNLIHADSQLQEPGSRFYLHARNAADAAVFLTVKGDPFEVCEEPAASGTYHVVGEREVDNLTLAKTIHRYVAEVEDVPAFAHTLVDFHSSRPGHDLRYAMNGDKLHRLGFEFDVPLDESLRRTVEWTLRHKAWLHR